MPIRRGATIPQTPAAATKEPAEKTAPKTSAAPLQDHSQPASVAAAAPAPAETASTPIAQHAPAQSALATTSGGMPALSGDASDDGFDALDNKLGFGSFPIVKLDKQLFMKGSEKLGSDFMCVMLGVKPKYLYKEVGKQETKYLVYSYTPPHAMSPELTAKLAEWAAEGIKYETKEYMECAAKLINVVNNTYEDGELVLLNVPPASVTRLAGYRMECKTFRKDENGNPLNMSKVITKCLPGDLVTVGKTTFYPWQFEYVDNY